VNSTVGSLIKVNPEMIYASGLLIVKYKFGEIEIAHASSIDEVLLLRCIDSYLSTLYGLGKAFVQDIVAMYEKLPHPDFAIALWEEGIGIGGEW